MSVVETFEQWCVVEIMGHKRFAGLVTEQSVGGTSFVRIDIPEVTTSSGQKLPAFTKLFGAASIYCLSPCTEETARAFAATIRAEGFALYEAPRLSAPPNPVRVFTSTPNDSVDNLIQEMMDGKIADPAADDQPTLVCFDESHVLTPADMDAFANRMGFTVVPAPAPLSESDELRIPAHPIEDAGFVDPIDNEPF